VQNNTLEALPLIGISPMTTIANDRIAGMLMEEANRIRKNWGWFFARSLMLLVTRNVP
jgi:hypothetical protein